VNKVCPIIYHLLNYANFVDKFHIINCSN